ncbi:MAG: PASTA domain-containing protein [Clostridiales Family XIII bacterium]|jgi:serine/threonine-protein kinase|nr:PASTA domain-containing protein [Clostridiales Family XIII bacterium]
MSTLVLAGRYEIVEKIGDGGMAVVYKARDKLLSRFVAIKILRKEYVFDQTFVENFRNESMAAGSLIHPNIVTIYDVGKDKDINYIVMEYVEGRALSDVIAAEAPLDYKRTISIGKQIASALDLAHRSGIIHRDVKPHNILITEDGTAKITDFGIAKAVSDGTIISENGVIMGSVHYFSPEQSRGQYVDEKTDIYSLGIVLYEMLTGRVPFDADNPVTIAVMHMNDTIIPPSRIVTGVPPGLDLIVMKATAKYQSDRFHNIDEMYKALDNVNFITGIIDDPEIAGFVKPVVLAEDAPGRGYNNAASAEPVPETPVFEMDHEESFSGGGDDRQEDDLYNNKRRTDSFYDDEEGDGDDDDDGPPAKKKEKEGFLAAFLKLDTKYKVIAIAIVVVVAFLISIPLQKLFAGMTADYVEVPNVVGTYYEDALETLTDLGFNVEAKLEPIKAVAVKQNAVSAPLTSGDTDSYSEEELSNAVTSAGSSSDQPKFKEGMVMEQDPVGGSKARYGYKIKLVVAAPPAGEEEVIEPEEPAAENDPLEVPNLVGLSKADAQKAIADAGFRLGEVHYEASNAAEGSVIAQTPKAGDMLVPGMSVSFTVSTGPKPITVQVPNVVGKARADAEAVIAGLGLKVSVAEEFSNTYPAGQVSAQNPAAGATVEEGATVTITVSKGPNTATVPNLKGMSLADAEKALADAGLTYGGETMPQKETKDADKAGLVCDQTLAPGAEVSRGEIVGVGVYVYVAPPEPEPKPVKVPDVSGKTEADATKALQKARFEVAVVHGYSDSVPPGSVIAQSATSALLGATITITVSDGPDPGAPGAPPIPAPGG